MNSKLRILSVLLTTAAIGTAVLALAQPTKTDGQKLMSKVLPVNTNGPTTLMLSSVRKPIAEVKVVQGARIEIQAREINVRLVPTTGLLQWSCLNGVQVTITVAGAEPAKLVAERVFAESPAR